MEETNTVKYYLARYFFLTLSVLQGLATVLLLLQFEDSEKIRIAAFVLFTFALVFFSLHLLLASRIKRVALGKKKLAIINSHKVKEYDWSDVKTIRLMPFLNMYSLKLKGKKNSIYFLSSADTSALFGLFTSGTDLIPRKVK